MSETQEALDAIFEALKTRNKDPLYDKYLDGLKLNFTISRKEAELASNAGKLNDTQKANYTKAANALPAVANDLKAAITAFESGDAMGGSAAIMDICSTVASVLGTMAAASSAAGPIGAFVGAIFGIVGMILRCFQPAQKSLGDVLEGKLRLIGAETIQISLATAIDEFESLYAGYPEQGPVKIKASMLVALSEGNAIDHVFASANWLLLDGNIKEDTITAPWLNVLAGYLHAESLQLRNLTHLLSVASANDYPALHKTYERIAKVHLGKMRSLTPAAHNKGMVWHIGTPSGVGNAGGVGGVAYAGAHLFKRQGADGSGPWTSLGGEQQNFSVARDPVGDGRHVVALEGEREGLYMAGFNFDPSDRDTLKWVPFHHHKRAYIKAVAGQWPQQGTDWHQLPGLDGCRDLVALPGDKAGEVYLFAAQNDTVRSFKVTRNGDAVTVSGDMEANAGSGVMLPGEKLLSIRVMPGHRPNQREQPVYLLKEKDGKHTIQWGVQYRVPHWNIAPPWDQVYGMAIDEDHLWIWKPDTIACLTHSRIKQMLQEQSTPEQFRKAWIWHPLAATVLDKTPGRPGLYEEGRAGLTYLAPSGDGTLMVVFNARVYTGTPSNGKYSDGFEISWHANDALGSRVLKEPIECWPLFKQHLAMLEDIVHDRKPHWDPTMRAKALHATA